MFRQMIAILLALVLTVPAALAHDVDIAILTEGIEHYCLPDDNKVDTIYRPIGQQWHAENDTGEGRFFLDYLEIPNEDAVLLRITVAMEMVDYCSLPELILEIGGNRWVFGCELRINEYDGYYYEDFYICLTDESLPVLRDMISAGGAVQVRVDTETPFVLDFTIDPAFIADMHDRYVNAGGTRQNLTQFQQLWPSIPPAR